jgi:hypothetical protein
MILYTNSFQRVFSLSSIFYVKDVHIFMGVISITAFLRKTLENL